MRIRPLLAVVPLIAVTSATGASGAELCQVMSDTQAYSSQSICVSSALGSQSGNQYDIHSLLDDNLSTAWCEGVKGAGIGESITLRWTDASIVDNIWLHNGYTKSDRVFYNNARVRDVLVTLWATNDSERRQMNFTLADTQREQAIPIPWPHLQPRQIDITILSTYPGTKYADTCMTEIWADFGF